MSRGTAWDGSKKPESPMIARLGTVGRLGEGGCVGAPENLSPNLNLTLTLNLTLCEAVREMEFFG